MVDGTPSTEISRSFLIGVFAVGIGLAVVISVLGIYGYLGAGIP
jgi:hypothetical protein